MKNLSLKLRDEIFLETEKVIRKLKVPRNLYINHAIDHYNKVFKKRQLKAKLSDESKLVAGESLKVLKEFESLED